MVITIIGILIFHGPSIGLGAGITAVVIVVVFLTIQGGFEIEENGIKNADVLRTEDGDFEPELIMLPLSDKSSTDTLPSNKPQISITTFLENGSPILGSQSAPITLIEFGDYQCHFCNVFFHNTKDAILKNYIETGKVRMIFKDYHIIGPDSVDASHGAHCAGEQGLFWEYHDVLYENWAGENTGWAAYENLESFAANIDNLDFDAWTQCMIDKPHSQRILASNEDARALGLTGTPSFYVLDSNERAHFIVGAQPYEIFANIFDANDSS